VPSHLNCVKCEAVIAYPSVREVRADAEDQWSTITDEEEWALRYITCNQCENGWAEVHFGENVDRANLVTGLKLSDADSTKLKDLKFPKTQNTYQFEYRMAKTECRECQKLINYQDKNTTQFTDNGLETNNRYKLVRRCEKTGLNANKYLVTQCGSFKEQENYLTEAANSISKGHENSQRGVYRPY